MRFRETSRTQFTQLDTDEYGGLVEIETELCSWEGWFTPLICTNYSQRTSGGKPPFPTALE
jgi:hypothetical protein